jgi:hypothetical protein
MCNKECNDREFLIDTSYNSVICFAHSEREHRSVNEVPCLQKSLLVDDGTFVQIKPTALDEFDCLA